MEGEQAILIQSQVVDKLINKYYKSNTEATKERLRKAQQKLDRMVLGRKLKQDEIDQLIREGITK
jgi:hypothetical protein